MRRFLTADTHYNHFNIIKYCNRPFVTLEEMNEVLIRNHNSRVKPEDEIYFIGDFAFKNSIGGKIGEGLPIKAEDILKRLNGRFIFVRGNHDRNNSLNVITESLIIRYGNYKYNLVHNPEYADIHYPINFCGHVHQSWKFKRIKKEGGFTDIINVGVDVNNFMPKTIEELLGNYHKWLKQEGYK